MTLQVRVSKRTPGMIVPDGQVHGRFYEPGEIATGEAAKVVLEWGCGDDLDAAPDDGFEAMKLDELRDLAVQAAVEDAAKLKKAALIEALRALTKAPPAE